MLTVNLQPEAWRLDDLVFAKNNDRVWFNARKTIYERELKAPMLALIAVQVPDLGRRACRLSRFARPAPILAPDTLRDRAGHQQVV